MSVVQEATKSGPVVMAAGQLVVVQEFPGVGPEIAQATTGTFS